MNQVLKYVRIFVTIISQHNLPMTRYYASIYSIPFTIVMIVTTVQISSKLCLKVIVTLTPFTITNYAATAVNYSAKVIIYHCNTLQQATPVTK
jgi:hypothetical protein